MKRSFIGFSLIAFFKLFAMECSSSSNIVSDFFELVSTEGKSYRLSSLFLKNSVVFENMNEALDPQKDDCKVISVCLDNKQLDCLQRLDTSLTQSANTDLELKVNEITNNFELITLCVGADALNIKVLQEAASARIANWIDREASGVWSDQRYFDFKNVVKAIPIGIQSEILKKTELPKKLAQHILANCVHKSLCNPSYIEHIGWGPAGRVVVSSHRKTGWFGEYKYVNVNKNDRWLSSGYTPQSDDLYRTYLSPFGSLLAIRENKNVLVVRLDESTKPNFAQHGVKISLNHENIGYLALSEHAVYYVCNKKVISYTLEGKPSREIKYSYTPQGAVFSGDERLVAYTVFLESAQHLHVADANNWTSIVNSFVLEKKPMHIALDGSAAQVACLFDNIIEIYFFEPKNEKKPVKIFLSKEYNRLIFTPDGRSLMALQNSRADGYDSIAMWRVRPCIVDEISHNYSLEAQFFALSYLNAQTQEAKMACKKSDIFCKNILNVSEELKTALGIQGLWYTGKLKEGEW